VPIDSEMRLVRVPVYRCDGPACVEVCDQWVAIADLVETECGWRCWNFSNNDIPHPRDVVCFCSPECLRAWARARDIVEEAA